MTPLSLCHCHSYRHHRRNSSTTTVIIITTTALLMITLLASVVVASDNQEDDNNSNGDGELLYNTSDCTWDAFLALQCNVSEYCVNLALDLGVDEVPVVECKGTFANETWSVRMEMEEWCYDDCFDDQEDGYPVLYFQPNTPLSSTTTTTTTALARAETTTTATTTTNSCCSVDHNHLTFAPNSGLLMVLNTTSVLTQPLPLAGKVMEYVYNVTLCNVTNEDDADYIYEGQTYCEDRCPTILRLDGVSCTDADVASETCISCPDNVQDAWACSNLDPTLVQSCDDVDDRDMIRQVLMYWGLGRNMSNSDNDNDNENDVSSSSSNKPSASPPADQNKEAPGTAPSGPATSDNDKDDPDDDTETTSSSTPPPPTTDNGKVSSSSAAAAAVVDIYTSRKFIMMMILMALTAAPWYWSLV